MSMKGSAGVPEETPARTNAKEENKGGSVGNCCPILYTPRRRCRAQTEDTCLRAQRHALYAR